MSNQLSDEMVLHLTSAQPRLYGFIFKRLANHEQAKEVLQNTNLVICQKSEEFEEGSNFIAWAFRIAHFQVLNYRQKQARERLVFNDDAVAAFDMGTHEEDDLFDRKQAALGTCMEDLSDKQRQLISQRYSGSHSVKDIAAELGTTVNAISKTLQRTRHNLLKCIKTKMAEAV